MIKNGWYFIGVLSFLTFPAISFAVEVSTATGNTIQYDSVGGTAEIEGNARVQSSSGSLSADKIHLQIQQKTGSAEGHVVVEEATSTILGTQAQYNWGTSTGVVTQAEGLSPPWRFSADQLVQRTPHLFFLERGAITSCDANPPDYWIRTTESTMIPNDRIKMKNPIFEAGGTPLFWLPFATKSLKPKLYSLRIEPGASSRDGLIVRSSLGYPITTNTYTTFRWNYFQRTGNAWGVDHKYNLPTTKGVLDAEYIDDTNPDDQTQQKNYKFSWNHFQNVHKKVDVNANINFVSTQYYGQNYGGVGSAYPVINPNDGLLSELGATYKGEKASVSILANRKQKYDPVTGAAFEGAATFPQINANTLPLKLKYIPFNTSFSATYMNSAPEISSADQTLHYHKTATAGTLLNRDFRLWNKATFTPQLGYTQSWQDYDPLSVSSPITSVPVYYGRYNTGFDYRKRYLHTTDLTASYRYVSRTEPNDLRVNTVANDHGVETNVVLLNFVSRIGRDNRLSLGSGYDLRSDPRNNPSQYQHRSARVVNPTMDLDWVLSPVLRALFRETYSVYDSVSNRSVGTPLNTSGSIQYTRPGGMTAFSQGFSFSKTPEGQQSTINLSNDIKFYLSEKWYIDMSLGYRAVGTGGLNYRKLLWNEKRVSAVRDLHCWALRMEFASSQNRTEASFYIDLKTNLTGAKNIFKSHNDPAFYPPLHGPDDLSKVFPSQSNETLQSGK